MEVENPKKEGYMYTHNIHSVSPAKQTKYNILKQITHSNKKFKNITPYQ